MKPKYRPAAIADIKASCAYIQDHLKNPNAAKNLKAKILQSVSLLQENPCMGTPLDSKYDGMETGLRFLVVSIHLIFYEVHEDMVEVVRILDGRTDYLSNLLD